MIELQWLTLKQTLRAVAATIQLRAATRSLSVAHVLYRASL